MLNNRITLALFNLLLLAGLLLAACAPTAAVAPSPTPANTPAPVTAPTNTPAIDVPRLRIKNAGKVDIKNLTVLLPESQINFGDVPAGTTSEYQLAPKGVYSVAAYEYTFNGKAVTQYVRDWVGMSPLPGASYTYEVSLVEDTPAGPQIDLQQVSVP